MSLFQLDIGAHALERPFFFSTVVVVNRHQFVKITIKILYYNNKNNFFFLAYQYGIHCRAHTKQVIIKTKTVTKDRYFRV